MKARAAHLFFAALLLGSVIANRRAGETPPDEARLTAAVIAVAEAHGFALRQPVTLANGAFAALAFAGKGCAEPIAVALLPVAFDDAPLLRAAEPKGRRTTYFYYGRHWHEPSRPAIFWERKRNRALALFGLTPYSGAEFLLAVDAPRACGEVDAIDWRPVWRRDFLTALPAVSPRLGGRAN